jgi:predicted enzyme related to lactoylglutathione lyase
MPDRPYWAILLSRHVQATIQFYRDAVGWQFEECPGGELPSWAARSAAGEVIALFVDSSASNFPDAPELWLPLFSVDDLDRRIDEAEKQGATVLRGPFDVAGFGQVSALRQPGGGIVAWRSPAAS